MFNDLHDISGILEKYQFQDSGSDTPELIITYGGDGALLGAERDYPGIPKLPLRDSATAPTCALHQAESIIKDFLNGKLKKNERPRLQASAPGGELSGINDLVIHPLEYTSALRCRVFINGTLHSQDVVGDGICFASAHGSTAYYRSITRGTFQIGVGLAFNNSSEAVNYLVLPENSVIRIEITRGPGLLMADNDPRKIEVAVGESITLTHPLTGAVYTLTVHEVEQQELPEHLFPKHLR